MHDAPGWYGKVGALGDFASRRVSPPQLQQLDQWLATVMAASQARLGPRWLDTYLHAPLWRYAWAPGVLDSRWWFGVLMPSCDQVGRYFPLLLAQPRTEPPQDRLALDHLELWWRHLAGAALATLDEHATLAAFEQALAEAPPWPTATSRRPLPTARSSRSPHTGRLTEHQPLPAGASLADALAQRAAVDLQARLDGRSLWWPVAPAGTNAALWLLHGLPDGDEFGALLAHTEPAPAEGAEFVTGIGPGGPS